MFAIYALFRESHLLRHWVFSTSCMELGALGGLWDLESEAQAACWRREARRDDPLLGRTCLDPKALNPERYFLD